MKDNKIIWIGLIVVAIIFYLDMHNSTQINGKVDILRKQQDSLQVILDDVQHSINSIADSVISVQKSRTDTLRYYQIIDHRYEKDINAVPDYATDSLEGYISNWARNWINQGRGDSSSSGIDDN